MTHPDNSVQMSGDGESEEGIAVEPLIKFVSIPANCENYAVVTLFFLNFPYLLQDLLS